MDLDFFLALSLISFLSARQDIYSFIYKLINNRNLLFLAIGRAKYMNLLTFKGILPVLIWLQRLRWVHTVHMAHGFENTTAINKDSPTGARGRYYVSGYIQIQLALAVTLLACVFIYLRVTSFSQGWDERSEPGDMQPPFRPFYTLFIV